MSGCRAAKALCRPRGRWWRGLAVLALGAVAVGRLYAVEAVRCGRVVRRASAEDRPLAEVIPLRGAG
ncbi:hypothetical protein [Kitasatospora sp. NPDC088134]|uniref:hypothetical protein n=1 Tax=Kitasatospora sp. NPDC088134 TaxID=3364071 RepID=UPI00382B15B2